MRKKFGIDVRSRRGYPGPHRHRRFDLTYSSRKAGTRHGRLLSYPTRRSTDNVVSDALTLSHSLFIPLLLHPTAVMSTEEPVSFNLTPEVLAQAKAKAAAAQDDHPEGATIRRQVRLLCELCTGYDTLTSTRSSSTSPTRTCLRTFICFSNAVDATTFQCQSVASAASRR